MTTLASKPQRKRGLPANLVDRRKLIDLKPHPQQQAVYGDLSDDEFDALFNDIEQNGLRHAVEITPDGIILDGHQRLEVYRQLGREEIEVTVCQGLDTYGIDERFILANLTRRQLDPVQKARAIKALSEVEHARDGEKFDADCHEFRERLAIQLGGNMSGRTVGRYLQLLRLPRGIQDAVSSGDLPLTTALKVESLSKSKQKRIAADISRGAHPRETVVAVLRKAQQAKKKDVSPFELYRKLLAFLADHLDCLENHVDSLAGTGISTFDETVEMLDRAIAFGTRMRDLESEFNEQDLVE